MHKAHSVCQHRPAPKLTLGAAIMCLRDFQSRASPCLPKSSTDTENNVPLTPSVWACPGQGQDCPDGKTPISLFCKFTPRFSIESFFHADIPLDTAKKHSGGLPSFHGWKYGAEKDVDMRFESYQLNSIIILYWHSPKAARLQKNWRLPATLF